MIQDLVLLFVNLFQSPPSLEGNSDNRTWKLFHYNAEENSDSYTIEVCMNIDD